MANPFETSFMPQQPLLRVEGVQTRRESVNFALVLAVIIFFVTGAVGVGMYFYKLQVTRDVATKGEQLDAAEKTLNISEINSLKQLQNSLDTAKRLVDEHTIFSVVLDRIEANAAENIGLTSLAFAQDTSGLALTLAGQAPSYAAVYFQEQQWLKASPFIKTVSITSPQLQEETGIVTFNAKITIDPTYLQYSKVLAEAASLPRNNSTVGDVATGSAPLLSGSSSGVTATASSSKTNTQRP